MAFQLFFSTKRRSLDQSLSRRRALRSSLYEIKKTHLLFWREHPSLLLALTLLIGTSVLLFRTPLLWPLLWFLYLFIQRLFFHIALLIGAIAYGWLSLPPSSLPTKPIEALFSPTSLQPCQSPFGRSSLRYQGSLSFDHHSLPCSIYYYGSKAKHPRGDWTFLVHGTLEQKTPFHYLFKTKKWTPVSRSYSLAEVRYQTKERLKQLLHRHLSSSRAALFLSSLTTGDVEDPFLRYEFSRLGLQHILAISGFHFGIVIAFCSSLLSLFLSRDWKIKILFIAVTLYFCFIGSSPAVQRSWLMALLFLLGQWLKHPTNGLNLLGAALFIELLLNPRVSIELGFQLSFLSCAAIFLFHAPCNQWLQAILPQRVEQEIQTLTVTAKHGYLLSSFLRRSMSLTLSVNILLLPLLLYHFHQFPLLSLLYNLFIPFLVSITLCLLLLALTFHLLFAPIGDILFTLTNAFTTQILSLTGYPLYILDYTLQIKTLPAWPLPLFFFLLFCLHLKLTNRRRVR